MIELLHFATQGALVSEPAAMFRYYMEVPSGFSAREKIAVSDMCRLVLSLHSSAGLRYSATRTDEFLPTGALVVNQNGTGFTCSTFVKNVFSASAGPIIDETTWPLADEADKKWFNKLLGMLRTKRPGPENDAHYNAIDLNCDWSRFRPEEVAAAARIAPPPARCEQVLKPAKQLLKHVLGAYPMLGG